MTGIAQGLVGPGERIGTITQVKGAVARMRRAGWPLVGLWLGTAAWGQGMQYAAGAAGLPIGKPSLDPAYLAYVAVATAIGAVISALGLRLMLRGPAGWLKVDAPLLRTAGLVGLVSGGFLAINAVYGWSVRGQTEPGAFMGAAVVAVVVYGLVVFLSLKLTLWPAGMVLGRTDLTAARSWRLMKRATRGLVLSYIVFALPVVAVVGANTAYALTHQQEPGFGPYAIAVKALAVGLSFCGAALTATLYDLRVAGPGTVADVFD